MVRKSTRIRRPTVAAAEAAATAADVDLLFSLSRGGRRKAAPGADRLGDDATQTDTAKMMIELGRQQGTRPSRKKTTVTAKRKRMVAESKATSTSRKKSNYRASPSFPNRNMFMASKFLPLRTLAPKGQIRTGADLSCPVIKGRPVIGGYGGVHFQMNGFSGGLTYRGPCRPNRVSPKLPPSGLAVEPQYQLQNEMNTSAMRSVVAVRSIKVVKTPPRTPQKRKANGSGYCTPSFNTSPVYGVRKSGSKSAESTTTTPRRTDRRGVLLTPTSMPIVKTPTCLTQSAKRFHDALVEASPLAMLASAAADMKSSKVQTSTQTHYIGARSNDVTPSPADPPHSYASKTPTIPIPTFTGKNTVQESTSAVDKLSSVGIKRYSIRRKETPRAEALGLAETPPSSLMSDLIFDKAREEYNDPPSLITSSPPSHHRPSESSSSIEMAQAGAAALTAVMTGKVVS